MENLKNTILNKIDSKTIKQKPRWWFVIYGIGGIIGGGILFLSTLLIVHASLLIIHEYKLAHTIGIISSQFEFVERTAFWIMVCIGIGVSLVFYRWVRNHGHLYRYKNTYTAIVFFAIIIGSIVSIRLFDQSMHFTRMNEYSIPGAKQLDRATRPPRPTGLISGKIIAITDDVLIIKNTDRRIMYVHIPPFEQINNEFVVDKYITVFGIIQDDQVDAERIIQQ